DAVAQLAGLECHLDPQAHQAVLGAKGQEPAPAANGWQAFSLEKPPEERQQPATPKKGAGSRGQDRLINLPPEHETLNLGIGIGSVQGRDLGTEITAAGKFGVTEVGLNTLLTHGPRGCQEANG